MNDTMDALAQMLREVMDDELDDLDLGPDTSFADDLEIESIELVALSEQVKAHWGDTVDFDAWIASQDLDQLIHLTLGDLATYVDTCRARS